MNLDARSIKKLEGLHPDLAKVVKRAAAITEQRFRLTEGVRTIARQRELVRKGASRTMRSRHITGHAVDVVALVGNGISWQFPLYIKISEAFKQAARELDIPIKWGGDWKSLRDGPHFQLTWAKYPAKGSPRPTRRSISTLRAGAAGAKVVELQKRLKASGIRVGIDGDFGPKTHYAVVRFQRSKGLKPDGIVGSKTWAALRKYSIN